MKHIGILGGSFDPPHKSHKAVIDKCFQMKLVNEVWVLPTYHHVQKIPQASFEQRIKMCKIMFERFLKPIKVKDFERCNRVGSTYNLIRILKGMFEKYRFSIIIGRDCAENIESWIEYQDLIQTIPFIVFERQYWGEFNHTWYLKEPHQLIHLPGSFISSTMIRKLLRQDHINLASHFTNVKLVNYIQKEKIVYEN